MDSFIKRYARELRPHLNWATVVHFVLPTAIVLAALWLSGSPSLGGELEIRMLEVAAFVLVVLMYLLWAAVRMTPKPEPERRNLILGLASLMLGTSFLVGRQANPRLPNFAPPEWLQGDYIENQVFRVADLVGTSVRLQGKTFRRCHFYGPAVFFLKGIGSIVRCHFYGQDPSDLVMAIKTNTGRVSGVIECLDRSFQECHFRLIGFATNEEELEALDEKFSESVVVR